MIFLQMLFFFLFWVMDFSLHAKESFDINKNQNFVIGTKKIKIKEYPKAFNPCISIWQGKLIMSFRFNPNPKEIHGAKIGIVWLDDEFNPIGVPQILETRRSLKSESRSQDARLINVDEHLFIVFNDDHNKKDRGVPKMYVAEVMFEGNKFSLTHSKKLYFKGMEKSRWEKNWVPFSYNKQLLLGYSISPHRILLPSIKTGFCSMISSSKRFINWKWGELRGGTPALKMGDDYLAFFHSGTRESSSMSDEKPIRTLYMGAYTFSGEPPFRIKKISSKPIISSDFYTKAPYELPWYLLKGIFPCGFIFNENYIWITYGRNDHQMWVIQLDRAKLLQSLVPVRDMKEK